MFKISKTSVLSFCALCICATNVLSAPPKLNYLFPAGGQRGQTVTVTASGTFSNWPTKIWIDRDGMEVSAAEKKGQLEVKVSPDAGAGVYWVRLFDVEGATELRPFVVGTLAEVAEKETNDALEKPQVLQASSVVNGKLAKGGDVDGYAIEVRKGQTLVASMQANETLGSPMDAVLQICSSDGFVLAQNDDARGTDPLIAFDAPADATYLVRTFAFPATANSSIAFSGADTYVYRLTITTDGFLDHVLPMSASSQDATDTLVYGWNIPADANRLSISPADSESTVAAFHPQVAGAAELVINEYANTVAREDASKSNPQAVEFPAVITGRIASPDETDAFAFNAKKGQKLSVRVESRALGFPLDPVLTVTDAAGTVIKEVDDASRNVTDPVVSFTAPADGEFRALVHDLHGDGGLRYVYRLTIEEEKTDFQLTLAGGEFLVTADKPLEIPVTITRKAGFNGVIKISAEGIPGGVKVEPVESLAKGDTAKTVKLKMTAANQAASQSFRIVGRASDELLPTRTAQFPITDRKTSHSQVWLTVTSAKSDDKK